MIPAVAGACGGVVSWANWNGALDGATTSTGGSSDGTSVGIVKISPDTFFAFWTQGTLVRGQVITLSGTTPSFGAIGTVVDISTSSPSSLSAVTLDAARVLIVYSDSAGNTDGKVISISGTNFTPNTQAVVAPGGATTGAYLTLLSADKVLMVFKRSNQGIAVVITTSATSITGTGSELIFESASIGGVICAGFLTSTTVIAGYQVSTTTAKALVLSVSGTTVSAGAKATLDTNAEVNISLATLSGTSAVATFLKGDGSSGRATPMSISGTTVTPGTTANFVAAGENYSRSAQGLIPLNSTQCMALYGLASTANPYGVVGSVSGSNITFGTPVLLDSAQTANAFGGCLVDTQRVISIFVNNLVPYVKILKQG